MGARRASTPCSGGARRRRRRASSRSSRQSCRRSLWVTLDHAFTGDWWWSSNIVDAYNDRFQPPLLHLSDLPGAVIERVGDVSTWPVALLALAALVFGLKQRPLDAARRLSARARGGPRLVVGAGPDLGRRRRAHAHGAGRVRGRGRGRRAGRAQRGHAARLAGRGCGCGGAAGGGALARGRRARRARPVASGARARQKSSRRRSSARRRRATWRSRASGRASSRSPGIGRASTFIPARAIGDGAVRTSARSAR